MPRKQKLADLQIRKKIRIDSKLQLAFFILSPARETCCVLSIWMLMHSCGLCPLAHQPYFPILQHCGINVPPDRLLRRSADNYFMLYLAESLTGRSYTEGKLLRYFPLWREGKGRKLCLLSANSYGIRDGVKRNIFFLQKASMRKLINESMRNVSRYGEKGGMTTIACRHWL